MRRLNLGFIIITIFLIIFIVTLTLNLNKITGFLILKDSDSQIINKYSYTKAICDKTSCQDYEIACNGKDVINITPIIGAIIKIPKDWQDPRPEEDRNKICG